MPYGSPLIAILGVAAGSALVGGIALSMNEAAGFASRGSAFEAQPETSLTDSAARSVLFAALGLSAEELLCRSDLGSVQLRAAVDLAIAQADARGVLEDMALGNADGRSVERVLAVARNRLGVRAHLVLDRARAQGFRADSAVPIQYLIAAESLGELKTLNQIYALVARLPGEPLPSRDQAFLERLQGRATAGEAAGTLARRRAELELVRGVLNSAL